MEIAAGNAGDEGFLFLRVSLLEVGGELSGGGEILSLIVRCRALPLPGFVTPDSKRTGVGRLRRAFGAEEALGHVPPPLGELRGAECDVDIVGIVEQYVVISVCVAVAGGSALAAASGSSSKRVRLQNPIADIDDVNVLFQDDVA